MKQMNEIQRSGSTSNEKKGGQMGSEVSAQQITGDLSTSAWVRRVCYT
ncbi:MAG: hypothetical protein H0W02_03255 [Ktedonobacteraceae bacterium]|nr:hypothetical protein [Ktedonobacteraceae bacterium]